MACDSLTDILGDNTTEERKSVMCHKHISAPLPPSLPPHYPLTPLPLIGHNSTWTTTTTREEPGFAVQRYAAGELFIEDGPSAYWAKPCQSMHPPLSPLPPLPRYKHS
eukprot:Filipodium_phascolosomae@DN2813_c7_g1_i3.p1